MSDNQAENQTQFIQAVCNSYDNAKIEKSDWGFSIVADDELHALRIAYAYRNNKHGTQIRFAAGIGRFQVTVFNEFATTCGIDRS